MQHADLRFNLVHQADRAFLSLAAQSNVLLDAAGVWLTRNPNINKLNKTKASELKSAVFDLGSIPKMLASEITRWKKGEDRVLSRMGVEQNLLNELYANMEALMWFYTREEIDIPEFNLDLVKASHAELLRCNRLL